MQCHEFESRLNGLLDARRNPCDDPRLARHAAACRECRQLASAMEVIGESLRWSERPEPDESLSQRVLANLAQPVPASGQPWSGKPWSVWTHAALAAAAALLFTVVLPRGTSQPSSQPAVATTLDTAQPSLEVARLEIESVEGPPVGQLALEATSHYASLARSTSDSLAEVWSLWQPGQKPVATVPAASPADQREPLLAEMAAGLQPLADSTTGAVSLLFDLLPQGETAGSAPAAPVVEPAGNQAAT